MNGRAGAKSLRETPVVTCFLRNQGEVLLLQRSADVGSYSGQWGAVAGYLEDSAEESAWREIAEETQLEDACTFIRQGEPFVVDDDELGRRWIVHPFLFDSSRRSVVLNRESTAHAWVSPTEILRREVVPELWRSYENVAPTQDTVSSDREHGSTYISVRALEVLRDRAAVLENTPAAGRKLAELATELIETHPFMASLRNRINRVMHAALNEQRSDAAIGQRVEAEAHHVIRNAYRADEEAARIGATLVAGRRVLTLSRSETVLEALLRAEPAPTIFVAASHPGGEGVAVSNILAHHNRSVSLVPDAAMAAVPDIDVVVFGADTVLADGTVVNKVGTRLAALVAHERSVPAYAVTSLDKVLPQGKTLWKDAIVELVEGGPGRASEFRLLFEVTPPHLVSGYATERGLLEGGGIGEVADELLALDYWARDGFA